LAKWKSTAYPGGKTELRISLMVEEETKAQAEDGSMDDFSYLFTLRFWVIFCLGMGVLLTIAAVRTHRDNAGEIPVVTSAAQFGAYYGRRLYVNAPTRRTGISHVFINTTGTDRDESIRWHLYIIEFYDMPVALISRNGNLRLDEKFFVSVSRLDESAIAMELLRRYVPEGARVSAYVARWSYRNLAYWTFVGACVLLAVGGVLLVIAIKRRKWNTVDA